MLEDVDRTYAADHMLEKHGVTVVEANEALRDPERIVIEPDYNSKSGNSIRIIGYSPTFGDVLSVIAAIESGVEYGVNGWRSNNRDRRIYDQGEDH